MKPCFGIILVALVFAWTHFASADNSDSLTTLKAGHLRLLPTVGDFDGVASSTLPLGANLDTAVTD